MTDKAPGKLLAAKFVPSNGSTAMKQEYLLKKNYKLRKLIKQKYING